jgi:transcriptional regulator with XRE-family HTH domain
MKTLNNILKFIDLKGLSIRAFEKEVGLSNGTINNSLKRKADLSEENIEKIVEKYSKELRDYGFFIIDMTTMGGGKSIINKDEKEKNYGNVGKYGTGFSIVEETHIGYGKEDSSTLPRIEIKTASGKKISVIAEGATEINLLNAFLEERERIIKIIEDQFEARISELKENNDRLYNLLNSSLKDLSTVQKAIFAMVRTGLEYTAAVASRGDKKKEVELLSSLTKLNNKNLGIDATEDKSIVLHK